MAVASIDSSTENLYEGMFLLNSADFASNPDDSAQAVLDILEKAGASIVTSRPWQDGRLAYPVKGHRKGLHYLTLFRMPGSGVSQVARACKLSDAVIRHMLIKHPPKFFDAMVSLLSGGEESPADDDAAAVGADAKSDDDSAAAGADAKSDDDAAAAGADAESDNDASSDISNDLSDDDK